MKANTKDEPRPAQAKRKGIQMNGTNNGSAQDVGSGALLGQRWILGKVFRCYSERFGTHDFLCVKCPGDSREDRIRFMEVLPSGESRELLFHSSAASDRVEKVWDNLLHYYAEVLA